MAINNKILGLVLILAFGFAIGTTAQTGKRKTKSRRTKTFSAIQPPATISPVIEPEVVSRAEDDLKADNSALTERNGINSDEQKSAPARPVKTGAAPSRKNNSAGEKEDRSLMDLERLSLAEGRAEAFRKQLSDVIEREAALRTKVEELDYKMRPEVIQGETSTIGSLRPEDVRDARRKMLENEKTRANDQLTTIMESRTRLESAIVNADALVDKLRARVEAETNEETGNSSENVTAKDSTDPQIPDN